MSATTGGRLAYERAIRRSTLPPGARHVALTVATWADIETGAIPDRFQPSLSTIAEATGLAKSSVKRQLSVLEDEGWLARVRPEGDKARTEHARTAYRLTVPEARPTVGLGPEWAMPGPMVDPELGPQSAKARPTVGHKSSSSSSSPSLPSRVPQQPPAAPAEREINGDEQMVLAAYVQALGRKPTTAVAQKIRDQAAKLIADGLPAWWIADRARELVERGWTDLAKHCDMSNVPVNVVRPADEQKVCNRGHDKFTPMIRDPERGLVNCPDCHPAEIARRRRQGAA